MSIMYDRVGWGEDEKKIILFCWLRTDTYEDVLMYVLEWDNISLCSIICYEKRQFPFTKASSQI